jgi:hypothetical protein
MIKKIATLTLFSFTYAITSDIVHEQALELWSFIDLIRASTIANEDQEPFLRETLRRSLILYRTVDEYLKSRYRSHISENPEQQELYELITAVGKSIFAVLKTNKTHEAIAIKVIIAYILDALVTPHEIDSPLST